MKCTNVQEGPFPCLGWVPIPPGQRPYNGVLGCMQPKVCGVSWGWEVAAGWDVGAGMNVAAVLDFAVGFAVGWGFAVDSDFAGGVCVTSRKYWVPLIRMQTFSGQKN